ncbi:MAG: DUF4118 domain-containing protein, partial [Candidatus Binataceae bacterium]
LQAANQELRGRLKVFLGAAPGVGKTYEMLEAARAKKADGVEVVVGLVETHGRAETEALLEGLEVIPRRQIAYKGRVLSEMDLDAILARRPVLALVDELAHSNAPGSRHPKRYQDVEELLAAGIDVYTTLNVQHLESLNDVIAKITRIRVRETLPDRMIGLAAEIEVVDVTPEELIQRLNEGKVYVKETAQRAVRHYFSPGNLTALRELALRRTAERVDEQMVGYMQAHAIRGPWPATERILVCVTPASGGAELVRHAKRAADRLRAPWIALYVQTPADERLSDADRDRAAKVLRLAEQLGARTLTLPGRRVAEDIIAYARETNVTQIVIGHSGRPRWYEALHGSVVNDLVRKAGHITVHVVALDRVERKDQSHGRSRSHTAPETNRAVAYFESTAMVALALLAGLAIDRFLAIPNISLVFLAAVLASAMRYGLGPSVYASLLSDLCYNFFFVPPVYTFTAADPANVLALVFFLAVAILTSGLAAGTHEQMVAARRQAKTSAELYAFSRKLAGIHGLDDSLWAITHQIVSMLRVEVVILMPEKQIPTVRAAWPPEDQLDDADLAAAKWCLDHGQEAGRDSETLPGARRLFIPLRTGRGSVGVLGIFRPDREPWLTPDERRLLDALADQAAVAIERTVLAEHVDEARIVAETERLRTALLSSVSHDLRTPLATILGTITSLRSYGKLYDNSTRDEMLAEAQRETERLNRFAANLLDITRIDTGAVELKRETVDLGDVVGSALQRAGRLVADHNVEVALDPDLPMLTLGFVLMEQVLVNLLDNAAKYAPSGSTIRVSGQRDHDGVTIEVLDEGPGIPEEALSKIFEKFYRVQAGDRQRAGTGLGLAICKGFVEAMGGTISAHNRTDRTGARLIIRFPSTLFVEPRVV